jgi:polyphosphate glucokinase
MKAMMEILGIDIGGTGIKGAIVNVETGELVSERHRIPTPEGAKPEAVANTIKEMIDHFQWKGKVGCGFPAIVSGGKARSASNIDKSWIGTQIDVLFQEKTGLDFAIANDADAAGMAEIIFGQGKETKGVVLIITIGTGIGSGLFTNGKLVPNTELGLVPYKEYSRFELFVSDSARKRDGISYSKLGKRFDKFLRFIEQTFSPDLIILGGGTSKKMEKFQDKITVATKVVPAKFQNNAGIVGAALLAK